MDLGEGEGRLHGPHDPHLVLISNLIIPALLIPFPHPAGGNLESKAERRHGHGLDVTEDVRRRDRASVQRGQQH